MTSLLADVLVTAEKFETSDLLEKTSELQTQISKLEYDVKEFIESKYIEFQPELKHDRFLTIEIQKRVDEMNVLQRRLQDQMKIGPPSSSSIRELKSLSNNLQKSNIKLELSNRLMDLSNFLEAAENYRREKLFVQAAETLQQVHKMLRSGNTDTGYSGIFNALKREYCTTHAMISTDVSILWDGYIEWEIKEADPGPSSVKLNITCDVNDMQSLLAALDRMDIMANNLDKFSNMLMKNVITPIINYQCNVNVTNELTFSVETLNKAERPSYNNVIHNFLMLFKFLDHHLNFDVQNDIRFLNKLGDHLFEQFSNSLTNDCISHTLPNSSTEVQDFKSVVKDILEFQDYLIEIGFITSEKIFLSRYIEDVDSLIINRKCQDFLEHARSMMKKDLHVSVRHEIQNSERNPIADDETDHRDPAGAGADAKLGKHSFQLEPYQISESVKGTVDLVRKILSEACRSSDVCAVRLSQTSRSIFEMYAFFVPEYHKTFLETIPQQVALFHNNCVYLAYHMFVLTREYKNKVPGDPWKHNVTYADLSLRLRSTGVKCFLEHMKYQRNIIVDLLKKSGWSMLGATVELPPSAEKAIQQSIKQLKLLKRVWFNVLPSSMYCRSLGYIINSMMEELITSVFSVEYIFADVATELVTLLNIVLNGTSSIFSEPEQIRSYARRWQKLAELVVVLGASLKEINDGWADGRGPLAREFTAQEVQHLIRMRFQNSEDKSMLLARSKLCLQ